MWARHDRRAGLKMDQLVVHGIPLDGDDLRFRVSLVPGLG